MKIEYTFTELANLIAKDKNVKDGEYHIIIEVTGKGRESKYSFEFQEKKNE